MSFDSFLEQVRSQNQPPPEAETRVQKLLLVSLATHAALSASAAAQPAIGATTASAGVAKTGSLLSLVGSKGVLVKGTLVLLAVGSAYVAQRSSTRNAPVAPAQVPHTTASTAVRVVPAASRAVETMEASPTPSLEARAPSRRRVEESAPAIEPAREVVVVPEPESTMIAPLTLADELHALRQIESALRAHDPNEALQLLARVEGQELSMREEFAAAETRAHCQRASVEERAQHFAAFQRTHPISPSLSRVRAECLGAE